MKNNPLIGASDMETARARDLVSAIIENRVFVVVNSKNYDCHFLQKGADYINQFTYVLRKWGYIGKSRNNDYLGHLPKSVPNQSISSSLNRFMNDAREAGLHNNERDWSGASFDTIWI